MSELRRENERIRRWETIIEKCTVNRLEGKASGENGIIIGIYRLKHFVMYMNILEGLERMRTKRYNLKEKVTLSIRPDVIRRLDEEADKKFVSRSQSAEMILREYFLGVVDNGEKDKGTDIG